MKVLLASRDLMAAGRLEAPAKAAGAEIDVVGVEGMIQALRGGDPDLLILDLDAGGRDLLARVEEARAERVLPERVVAYFSHIDEEMAEAA
jgi:DNA-binding response OmpR family regulator